MKRLSNHHYFRAELRRRRLEVLERRRKIRRRERRERRERAVVCRREYSLRNGLLYDNQLSRYQLVLPRTFSLSTNYEETALVLAKIRQIALREQRRILLHFEHVNVIEPAAALALVSEIYRVRNLHNAAFVTGTYPRDRDVFVALRNMGFFKFLSIVDPSDIPADDIDPSKPIYLNFLTDNRADWGLADSFVSIVEKHLIQFNELARQRLVKAIGEAINNTLDHAHPAGVARDPMRNRWWLSAWVNIQNKEIAIIVLDKGVGIPSTLPPTDYEKISAFINNLLQFRLSATPTDGELLIAATEYHRSGTGSGERGRGFYDMKQFIDVCTDGELSPAYS